MKQLSVLFFLILLSSCSTSKKQALAGPHIVFIMADDEYRSEESMPMLGSILIRELNAKISYCFAADKDGYISPNTNNHIDNLDALKTADLVVFFARFRALPDDELNKILDYVESGRPIVGFRTSTHTFLYKDNPSKEYLNNKWPASVFGQQWITHHGHFDDGQYPLTKVSLLESKSEILNGIKPFDAFSWLYHVDGGDWKLNGDCTKLLEGKAIKTNHDMELMRYPLVNPVAWIKTYTGSSGIKARVFFTTLGHPYDFKNENMRKLATNGIFWALGKEKMIPSKGTNVDLDLSYNPSKSGFGEVYKHGVKVK
jgi:uncharacterized protein